MKPILSLRDLSFRLGLPLEHLQAVAEQIAQDKDLHYSFFSKSIGKSKVRHFRVPKPALKEIQRRIVRNILNPMGCAAAAHGGVRGASAATNAGVHRAQDCVVNMDVRSFFDKVRHEAVYRMFRHDFEFGRDVASLLTRLTTLESLLPQGAPTSPSVANLVMTKPVDVPLMKIAEQKGLKYTRYVDDLTFSGDNPRPMINIAARLLSGRRLPMYRGKPGKKTKLRITPRSAPQEVTGLLVNSEGRLSVASNRRDKIRGAIHGLKSMHDPMKLAKETRSIAGRISYIGRYNAGEAQRLRRLLEGIAEPQQS